jgi:hypothetical protein
MSTNVMGTKFVEENVNKTANLVNAMNNKVYEMLRASAQADITKAKLSLDLLGNNAVGIGDHSTEDFYKNAEEALALLADANDRLKTLENFYQEQINDNSPIFCTQPKNK